MSESKHQEQKPPEEADRKRERRPYQSPRIVKKRTVSRATLFSGSGPDTGGVVSQ